MRWRIWYDDGTELGGCDEQDWEAFPRHGVLIVREYQPVRLYHMGLDYYWLEGGSVKSCSRMDIDRYLERPQGIRCVKFGRWANQYTWEQVHEKAKAATEPCGDCE